MKPRKSPLNPQKQAPQPALASAAARASTGRERLLSRAEEVRLCTRYTTLKEALSALALMTPAALGRLDAARDAVRPGGANAQRFVEPSLEGDAEARGRLLAWRGHIRRLHQSATRNWECLEAEFASVDASEEAQAMAELERIRRRVARALQRARPSSAFLEELLEAARAWLELQDHDSAGEERARRLYLATEIRAVERDLYAIESRIVSANQGLVGFVVKRYAHLGMSLPDLMQEGSIGLMRAVEKFDPSRGVRFNTYAVWWIRQAVRRAISNQSRAIRIPVHQLDRKRNVDRAFERLTGELGRAPSTGELECETGERPAALEHLTRIGRAPISLESPCGPDSDLRLLDVLADRTAANSDDGALAAERKAHLDELLSELTPREQGMLRMRFGLGDRPECTLAQVGCAYGVTRERVRQIINAGLLKLHRLALAKKIAV